MEKQRLREELRRLHEELERSELPPDARARLGEITRDIESLLESEAGSEGLAGRLRSATDHFEESHPALTAVLGRIADALAALGI